MRIMRGPVKRRRFFNSDSLNLMVRPSIVLLAITVLSYGNLLRVGVQTLYQPVVHATPYVVTAHLRSTTSASKPAPAAAVSSTAIAPFNSSLPVAATPACTTTSYTLPAALPISSLPVGLSQVVDAPHHYNVYGDNLQTVRTQLTSCGQRQAGLNDIHNASTSYVLNWQYTAVNLGNGLCQVTNVRVGVHVNQILPAFTPSTNTPAAVTNHWQMYASSLQTHEDGHTRIDIMYATNLLAALQSIPALDCSSVSQQVNSISSVQLIALTAANNAYDAQTNHGATQGAVL